MRVVIKVGTSSLTHKSGHLNVRKVEAMCKVLSDLKNAGNEIILVSSGAIAMGVGKLHLPERPSDVPTKQATAAVGQCELMYIYDKLFSEYNHTVAQILITIDDMKSERRHQNFQNTMNRLLQLGTLPIINENDTVSFEEFGIGDNDTLSAFVAVSINADLLILLSDIDGLYTADPHKDPDAKLIPVIENIDDSVISVAGGAGTERGTGGMKTKIGAAMTVTEKGTDMIITNAANIEGLYDIFDGKSVGTRFLGKRDKK
ncbi:MAG: glutamate 5-kinase [Acutalibacteraceae bacterium]|nr:glutamate 5-kinase [Oscillospiraceae bacterium]